MDQFIARDILEQLSYRSTLGQSLKQISLRGTPLALILDDISKYRSSYIDVLVQENLIGSRFKVRTPSYANIKGLFNRAAASSSALMMCWVSGCILTNIRKNTPIISVLLISGRENWWMTATGRSISTISGIIWPTPLRCSSGAGQTTGLTSGATSMSISINPRRWAGNYIWNSAAV